MKQIIASVFSDIYTIGNIIFVFLNLTNITARVYKLRLAEVNFLSCFFLFDYIEEGRFKQDRKNLGTPFPWEHCMYTAIRLVEN